MTAHLLALHWFNRDRVISIAVAGLMTFATLCSLVIIDQRKAGIASGPIVSTASAAPVAMPEARISQPLKKPIAKRVSCTR